MKVSRGYHGGNMKVSRGRILCVLYVAYSTQRRHYILTAWPKYAMLFAVHVRAWGIQAGGGRSAVRCCGLFSCLHLVPRLRGGLAPGRRAMSRVSLRSLAGLKRYARLPCRCAAAALSGLRRCGGSAGARPLRRVLARSGNPRAAAAGKEKAGLAAGFPGKRKIRTPFSCR